MADALKAEGNKLFAAKDFKGSIEKFTQAIEADPANHVLYSNRSGSYASMKDFQHALEDAAKTTEIKPDWAKGWSRKGAALHGLNDLVAATEAYDEALKLDPNNAQAKSGLDSVKRAIEGGTGGFGGDPSGGLGSLFQGDVFEKIGKNPKTAHLLSDPQLMSKLQQVKQNPNLVTMFMQDPKFIQCMGVLMGVDMHLGTDSMGEDIARATQESQEDVPMPDAKPAPKAPEPEPEPEPEPDDEETRAKKEAKAKADEEKALGTQSYKKRQFDEAIEHYNKAWEIYKDITYLNNLGAAKFEKGDYQGAIEACQQAVDHGREVLADFKMIAKAFGRIGSSYEKMGDLSNAIEYYQRSLTEHRDGTVLTKLRAAQKAKLTADKDAYISPEKAEEARTLGNEKFKAADWPAAVDAYSEMIKRAPEDARGYSNRAACFIKLLTFPSAVQDCDEAIKRDPAFIRAYLRKAQALHAMREYSKCIDVCGEAEEHDVGGKNFHEIDQQRQKAIQGQFSAREGETEEQTMERIQRDPEIVGILQDPVMQSILQQAKGDPAALQDHMKNAGIRNKINKLVAAGVIRVGR